MNLPAELRDELLSGYLDGELSADEQARVERMLERDEGARRVLAQLRELGRDMRAASVGARLDGGFAERVWEATVAEADRQGLSDDHPVRRAEALWRAAPGAVRLADRRPMVWGGALSALAASLFLVAVLWNRGGDERPLDQFADADRPGAVTENQEGADGDRPRIASVDRQEADSATADDANRLEERPRVDPPALAREDRIPEPESAPTDAPGPTERIAAADSAEMDAAVDDLRAPEAADELADALGGEAGPGFVLVLDLMLSELGLEEDVLGSELERIGLGKPAPLEVGRDVVDDLRAQQLVGDTAGADKAGAQIFLLEGSAKRLDRLMVRLGHPEIRPLVAAARMTMLQDASWLRRVAEAEAVDAAAVRHAESRERAIQLVFEDDDPETPEGWFGRGADLGGADLANSPLGTIASPGDDGPDFITQTLVRVRVER